MRSASIVGLVVLAVVVVVSVGYITSTKPSPAPSGPQPQFYVVEKHGELGWSSSEGYYGTVTARIADRNGVGGKATVTVEVRQDSASYTESKTISVPADAGGYCDVSFRFDIGEEAGWTYDAKVTAA